MMKFILNSDIDKEKILLECLNIVEKDIEKNEAAIYIGIKQLLNIDPKVGIKYWEDLIKKHYNEIQKEFNQKEFSYDNIGYFLVNELEKNLCDNSRFKPALNEFSKSKYLLDVLYTKSPISENLGGVYAIGYLIRQDRLEEADRILTAIYKNDKFKNYEAIWNTILFTFKFDEDYNPGMFRDKSKKQPKHIQDFVMSWIDKIPSPKQKKSAISYTSFMY